MITSLFVYFAVFIKQKDIYSLKGGYDVVLIPAFEQTRTVVLFSVRIVLKPTDLTSKEIV